MKNKLHYILFLLVFCSTTLIAGSGRMYNHKNATLNGEIDNIYFKITNRDFVKLNGFTTAQLMAITPYTVGLVYWNKTTNEFWISTGTAVNQFIHK